MIKLVAIFEPRVGMDMDQAWDYWLTQHAPTHTGDLPETRRYTLSRTVGGFGGASTPLLGMAEMWFDSQAEAEAAFETPIWQAAFADAANCCNMDNALLFWSEEHEISLTAGTRRA